MSTYSRKWYLLDPALYERIKVQTLNSEGNPEVQYKQFVNDYGKSKIEERNLRDETLKDLGESVKKILPSTPLGNVPTPANVPLNTSTTSTSDAAKHSMLIKNLPKAVRGKGIKLFYLLKHKQQQEIRLIFI